MSPQTSNYRLSQRLLRYSAVAGMATAGALTIGPTATRASGEVVWIGPETLRAGVYDPFPIDFDGNGTPEFVFSVTSTPDPGPWTGAGFAATIDALSMQQSVSFLATATGVQTKAYPLALEQSAAISSSAGSWAQPMAYICLTRHDAEGTVGNWLGLAGTEIRYLGIRYKDNANNIHYGWVELTLTDVEHGGPQLTIHRYGHSTSAGAGTPAAVELGALDAVSGIRAAGAAAVTVLAGVANWLRRKLLRA